ncbi:putative reverse transcriptase zinc-binding domain-containing protein [Helianthus annuus]|nr:putative reverse transcriptase zinc-binding domain-containing protein [Helianthus annuus]KAJ0553807.1 putative reverse transcriptase zinc-binding domain-containing protein [Helianthus annuus]KAJ0719466.1 putative reverse transcriptase zinc-binding domain-containing protein [Helianthus annuus]KAJ0722693.1 putative reverse transcriptase zinc-binding domain-containing protein [Helianthus annuus]KAJ0780096.1 putative reverse transcriptase zinc-binding domain-containing protein [Helianthus annuus
MREWLECEAFIHSVSISEAKDEWEWLGEESGEFSVKSVKRLLNHNEDYSRNQVIDWCRWLPLKCNIFAWRATLNRLPTKAGLMRRNITVEEENCACCGETVETVDHIFTGCYTATVVWHFVSSWCNLPPIFAFSFKDLMVIHKELQISKEKAEVVHGIIIIAAWSIWNLRNDKVFSRKEGNSGDIIESIKSYSFLWFKYRKKCIDLDWKEWCNHPLYKFSM